MILPEFRQIHLFTPYADASGSLVSTTGHLEPHLCDNINPIYPEFYTKTPRSILGALVLY